MSQPITNLNVSDLIKFGNYQVEASATEPIIWMIIDFDHADYPADSVTLLTKKMIDLRGFDAKESGNANADRVSYGNNRYRSSNLRQWLNSGGAAGVWWAANNPSDGVLNTNNADATPADAGFSQTTGYDDIQGFMANFTADELAEILDTVDLTVALNTVTDTDADHEHVTDKIFLLSETETGLGNENGIVEGTAFAIFAANADRIAYLTTQARLNTLSASKPANDAAAWYWWLRTPVAADSRYARYVYSDGTPYNGAAYNGCRGVRPALNLSSGILVSDDVDEDGCYVVEAAPPSAAGGSMAAKMVGAGLI